MPLALSLWQPLFLQCVCVLHLSALLSLCAREVLIPLRWLLPCARAPPPHAIAVHSSIPNAVPPRATPLWPPTVDISYVGSSDTYFCSFFAVSPRVSRPTPRASPWPTLRPRCIAFLGTICVTFHTAVVSFSPGAARSPLCSQCRSAAPTDRCCCPPWTSSPVACWPVPAQRGPTVSLPWLRPSRATPHCADCAHGPVCVRIL